MKKNIVSTIKMMSFDVGKTFGAIFLVGLVFVGLTYLSNEDIAYSSSMFSIMIVAGMSALFFTEAGVYQSVCLSFGCTRKAYFIAMQIVKIVLAVILYSVLTVLGMFVFKTTSGITAMSAVVGILSYTAMFSGTELFGYLTVKIGRWGLAIVTIIIALSAGVISGLSLAAPELLFEAIFNLYIVAAVLLVLSVVFSACTYIFVKRYAVRG